MGTKEEFIKEIIDEVKGRLDHDDWYGTVLIDGGGHKAYIAYGYDESAAASNKMNENHLTNFESWKERAEWDEYDIYEQSIIHLLERELNLFLYNGTNQYGDRVWVDCYFEDGFDPEKRDYIEDNCRILYDDSDDYKSFQDELNEMDEDEDE